MLDSSNIIIMTIRPASAADQPVIQTMKESLQLYREGIFGSDNKAFHQRIVPRQPLTKEDISGGLIFVAEADAAVIGFIAGSIHQRPDYQLSQLGCLDDLFVEPAARGHGVAQALLAALEQAFAQRGVDHMTVHTDSENELSQQFYHAAGFRPVTVELWKKLS